MSLSNPVTLFGIHSATFYNRTNRIPFAFLRVLGDASMELAGETEDLVGGSNMYPWDSEAKSISSEVSFTAREYPVAAMELLLAGTKTEYDSEANGEVVDVENVSGTTYGDGQGVASVALSVAEGNTTPVEGDFVVEVASANTVNVYAMSNVDFGSNDFTDDTLKIKSGLTITTSGATEITGYGVKLVGGADTDGISMNVGDTFKFSVRRKLVSGVKLVVGQSDASFDEFGCILTGQKGGAGAITYVDIFRCKAAGMPINFAEKAYSEWQITLKALYDSAKNGVFAYIRNAA